MLFCANDEARRSLFLKLSPPEEPAHGSTRGWTTIGRLEIPVIASKANQSMSCKALLMLDCRTRSAGSQ